MDEQNMISDLRQAKTWLDRQSASFADIGQRLRLIEQAYQSRTGEFASVPRERSEAVRRAIEAAADEPGRELLREA